MATKNVYVRGKLSWVRPDKADKYGNYTATLHPDAESLEKIRDLCAQGVKNQIKKDEDGYCITFRRPTQKMMRGKVVGFTPVELLDGTKPLDGGGFAPLRDVAVGNGSDGVIKLQIYSYPTPSGDKGLAARLESIRIDNLVPFRREDFNPDEERQNKGIADIPAEELF